MTTTRPVIRPAWSRPNEMEETTMELKEPARNDTSTVNEKAAYAYWLTREAKETGDAELAWKLVDFLYDTMLLTTCRSN